eukprot:c20068_g1_i12.p1 GENE.c20068_g1_i12~~c20068_g1_i12.p1  ORF type:complete len:150 (+),score=31.14 c20068_g1_i12:807-1256(+)
MQIVGSNEEWADLVRSSSLSMPLFAVFKASWCSDSKNLLPLVQDFAEMNKSARFVEVDVDELADLSIDVGVQKTPAVFVFIGSKSVGGRNAATLEDVVGLFSAHCDPNKMDCCRDGSCGAVGACTQQTPAVQKNATKPCCQSGKCQGGC